MNDSPINDFYNALEETRLLIKYFHEGYDFGVDPYDPIVDDLLEIVYELEQLSDLIEKEVFIRTIFRGIEKHITLNVRYDLYEKLNSIYNLANKKDKEYISMAKIALEDMNIYPGFIGLVRELYINHLFNILYSREQEESQINSKLFILIEKAKISFSDEILNEIIKYGQEVLPPIEEYIFDEDFDDEFIENLIKIVSRIPCHYSAYLLVEILYYYDHKLDIIMRLSKQSGLLPYLTIHLLNKLDKPNSDFFDRWLSYEFLTSVKEYRVFKYLRREFLDRDYWSSYPESDESGTHIAFYTDITNYFIQLEDRRGVPVFIKLLHEGRNMGFSEEIRGAIRNILSKSIWHEEIERGLRLLKEGELVFVNRGEDLIDILKKKTESYTKIHSLIRKASPNTTDLQQMFAKEENRWMEAYHEELDGLRPVDFPIPPIKNHLMERMIKELEKEDGSSQTMSIEEANEWIREFQSNWLITPLPDYNNEIPLAMILREEEKLSKTFALKEHFKQYKGNTINTLYLDAIELFEEGDREGARKKVNAVLQIDPDYPFAKSLKKLVESN